jgi:hypothetical protein
MRNLVHAAILATVTLVVLLPFAMFLSPLLLPGLLLAFAFYGSQMDQVSTSDSFIFTNILGDFVFYMLF